jgi:hypothetical protein
MKTSLRFLAATTVCSLCIPAHSVCAQGTAFIYQGRLTESGTSANGSYDFQCQLYNRATVGEPGDSLVSSTVTSLAVPVTNGLFVLNLDFGAAPFTGEDRWLLIRLRTNNALNYINIFPRQRVAPTPYSIRSGTAAALAAGSNQTFTGTINFNPASGSPFTVGNSLKVPNLNADLLDGLDSSAFVLKAGDTMTGKLTVTGPGGTAIFSDVGFLLGNDIAVAGGANSAFGIGVSASSSGDAGYGVFSTASGNNGVGVYADASTGANARGLYGRSTSGLAGYFDGAVQVLYASPFNKPQLQVSDPSDSGFTRLRMQTGTRPFWDIAVGTTGGVLQTNSLRFFSDGNGDVMTLATNGNLFVRVITITGGADIAEPFKMSNENLPKGSVVVIDEDHAGQLKPSTEPYDTRVAGVISGANGVKPGLALNQQGVFDGEQHVALTGRVYVQADASFGAIKPGDLLTTSATPGHAMKVSDSARAQGAILGKAMSGLKEGKGMVLVLVTLQ